ncbi:hypothetical protein K9M79_02275 [Candidatus Woesearchaeota archaeon]|nr:hypothetical protein [Candidatus Woesearchaeota archaeon]
MKQKISITISDRLIQAIDEIVDNIYIRNRSQAIEYLVQNALGENRTAVILAGGSSDTVLKGTREYRMTAKLGKSTVIGEQIRKLHEGGFKNIYIVARNRLLTKAFEILKDGSALGVNVNYIEEKTSRGTAQTLHLLRGKIKTTFLCVYGDLIFNKVRIDELWNSHMKRRPMTTLMVTTSSTPSEKGIVEIEGTKIINFMQKPRKSDVYLVFSPIFVSEPEIFEYYESSLEVDVFPRLAERGLLQAYISSIKEFHVHKADDVKKAKLYI